MKEANLAAGGKERPSQVAHPCAKRAIRAATIPRALERVPPLRVEVGPHAS